jgi:hypothetical protein
VHAAAVDALEGFRHVSCDVACSCCDNFAAHLHSDCAVSCFEGFTVFEVNFVLSKRDFVVADFNFYAEGFCCVGDFTSKIVS